MHSVESHYNCFNFPFAVEKDLLLFFNRNVNFSRESAKAKIMSCFLADCNWIAKKDVVKYNSNLN